MSEEKMTCHSDERVSVGIFDEGARALRPLHVQRRFVSGNVLGLAKVKSYFDIKFTLPIISLVFQPDEEHINQMLTPNKYFLRTLTNFFDKSV